jgi:hypothetical protein
VVAVPAARRGGARAGVREEADAIDGVGGRDDATVALDDLTERTLRAEQLDGRGRRERRRSAPGEHRREGVGPGAQVAVDGSIEAGLEAEEHEAEDDRQGEGQQQRAGERQSHAQRQEHHPAAQARIDGGHDGASRRYPAPRTVRSIGLANGRSSLPRSSRTYASTTFERC